MSESLVVAIVGTGLVAEQIAASLAERDFPLSSLRFLSAEAAPGDSVEVDERAVPVERLGETLHGFDLVFLTRETEWEERDIEALALAGAMVVDTSGRYARELDVPLLVPECNPDSFEAARERRVAASPDAVTVALSVVLAPLRAEAGLRRVVATCLESVSEAGAAGIEELGRQTVDLLQGRSAEPLVFPARTAFNVLPLAGPAGRAGDSLAEEQAVWQVRRVLEDPELPISVCRLAVPLFYGTGIAVNVELSTPLETADALALLRSAPGILATTAEEEGDLALADAVGQDATLVSRVRADRSAENTLNLWIALDNLRKGCAVNAVQIAESLLLGTAGPR